MPPLPEIREGRGKVGAFEIGRQVDTEQTADPPGDIRVASEIVIERKCIRNYPQQQELSWVIIPWVFVDIWRDDGCQGVCKNEFPYYPNEDQTQAGIQPEIIDSLWI